MNRSALAGALLGALLLSSCATTEKTAVAPSAPPSKELLERRGHQLYATGALDSASAVLRDVLEMDPANRTALTDLASLHYDLAMREPNEKSPARMENLKASRRYFAELERLGEGTADLYDRLCETSMRLGDDKAFLTYAKKSAAKFPFDRQYHNLGLAYFNVGDYQKVIKTEKQAIEKFKNSSYMSSFYRQLGRAYMKVDRDQTAERTLEDGLKIVNQRLEGSPAPDERRRLVEDKVGILISLRSLYQTYRKDDKLKDAERQLREAGYTLP